MYGKLMKLSYTWYIIKLLSKSQLYKGGEGEVFSTWWNSEPEKNTLQAHFASLISNCVKIHKIYFKIVKCTVLET